MFPEVEFKQEWTGMDTGATDILNPEAEEDGLDAMDLRRSIAIDTDDEQGAWTALGLSAARRKADDDDFEDDEFLDDEDEDDDLDDDLDDDFDEDFDDDDDDFEDDFDDDD